MSIYTSQGTIRIRCDIDTNSITTLYFVPENDYSIKHRNDNYAVFVSQSCDCKTQSWKNALIRKYDPDKGNGVEIHVARTNFMYVISSAAVHQSKVEVEVETRTKLEKMAERKISEIAKKIAETRDGDAKKEAMEQVMNTMLMEVAKGKISEIAEKVAEEVAEAEDENAKKKAVQVMKAELQKLVEVANKSKQYFELISITIPAK